MATTNFIQCFYSVHRPRSVTWSASFFSRLTGVKQQVQSFLLCERCTTEVLSLFSLRKESSGVKLLMTVKLLQFAFGFALHVTYRFSISGMRIAQTRALNSQVCKHSNPV